MTHGSKVMPLVRLCRGFVAGHMLDVEHLVDIGTTQLEHAAHSGL